MKIRFGYVAIAMNLPKVTSSSTVTYKYYNSIYREEDKMNKLKSVTLSNFTDLEKILKYNIKNDIHFYRLTSKLIPLATHPEVNWQYRTIFRYELERIGAIIKLKNLRVNTHLDQFNVLNSDKKETVEMTIRNISHHYDLFTDMKLENARTILHIGSAKGGKLKAVSRLVENFSKLPQHLQDIIMFENDDKLYTVQETLYVCEKLKVPMVLDVHHYICNQDGEELASFMPRIFKTWESEKHPPEIQFSSPRDYQLDRKHADYIKEDDVIKFLEFIKQFDTDIDIMIEAKKKDLALLELLKGIRKNRPEWTWLDKTTLEI